MISWETLLIAIAISLLIGGVLGAIISRALIPPEMQKDLEEKIQGQKAELDKYQQDVAKHFADTAQLVTSLTQSYKEVHDHLSKGAIKLTSPEISNSILKAGDSSLGIEANEAVDQVNFEPPKDWGPQNSRPNRHTE